MIQSLEPYVGKRKAQIILAVFELADRFGTAGITTKRIAAEVGFVEGAIYKHFKSKDDIFETILDLMSRILDEMFRDLELRSLSPDRCLREWMEFALSDIEDKPGLYRLLFSDELYVENRKLFLKFKGILVTLAKRHETLIEEGIRQGLFRVSIQPESMAKLYLGVIHTAYTLWNVFEERRCRFSEMALPLFEEYMKSIAPPKEKNP